MILVFGGTTEGRKAVDRQHLIHGTRSRHALGPYGNEQGSICQDSTILVAGQ